MHKFLITAFVIAFGSLSCFSQYKTEIDSLLRLFKASKNDSLKVDYLNDIGGFRIKAHAYDEALNDLLEARTLSRKINYKNGLSNALQRIGVLLMNKNNFSEAMDYYNKAIQIKSEIGDKKGIADITSNIGIIYSNNGEYGKAMEKYFEALKIREEIGDAQGTGISMISIANIYYLQYNFNQALNYYFKALKIPGIEKYIYFIAEVNTNIGMSYFQLKNYEKASPYFNIAVKIDEEIGDKQGIAINLSNLGGLYMANKDYLKALELLNQAKSIFEEIEDQRGIVEIHYELGNVYDSIHDNEKAIECFNRQLQLAKGINSKVNVKNAYEGLSRIYQKNKNYAAAYQYYKLFKAAEDSIKNESLDKTITEMEAKYNANKKEKEIEQLRLQQQIKDTENQKRNQLIFGLVAIGIATSVLILLLYNRNQLQKKNALERKNFELERNALANQMNPHFIFNSLGSISGFVAENEKEKAIEYLGIFSKLIRYNLEQSREQLVAVEQEARMLKVYLHLQQLRFENKFTYDVLVSGKVDGTVALPPMFVQPFVENAILHGLIPKEGNGNVTVRFDLNDNEELICIIEDDGIGISESKRRKSDFKTQQKSLAMTIVEERKEIINSKNKNKISITIKEKPPGETGTVVELIFPVEYV